MTRYQLLRRDALSGISQNTLRRIWIMSHKSADDWRREAEGRQAMIIKSGLALGIVTNGARGYEVRP